MSTEVRWTAPALADLRAIFTFTYESSPDAAARTVLRITARAATAGEFPAMGRAVPEFAVPVLRELIDPPYRIIYEVFPDRVEVLAVLHSSRLFPGTR